MRCGRRSLHHGGISSGLEETLVSLSLCPPTDKKLTTQPGFPMADTASKVTVRSARGDGTRLFVVDAAIGSVAEVKQLLCRPPHSLCSDASFLVLVVNGDCAVEMLRLIALSQIHVHVPYLATTLRSLRLRLMRAVSALLLFSHPATLAIKHSAAQFLSIFVTLTMLRV